SENKPSFVLHRSCSHSVYSDCSEVFADGNVASGLYVIRPDGSPTALSVYCDMNNGGGWTVFQRRSDGKESFDRAWVEYKHGFGDIYSPKGEFWLGNEPLHYLTSQGKYDLRIDMEDFDGNERYAEYKNFRVDPEKGASCSHLCLRPYLFPSFHPSFPLSSPEFISLPLIILCHSGNLNGHYYNGPYRAMTDDGVVWYTWHGWWYSIKSVVMMVRAADLESPPTGPGKAAGSGLPQGL
uniref:Fibrinogen-like protein 1 n=1 Tax=Mola mola TaxID=94237 RepID=A0A3Q3X035_MOLML